MMAHETVEKCKAIYVEMDDVQKEKAMHEERVKDCKKRIDGFQGKIQELITATASPQMSLLEFPGPPDVSEFTCTTGDPHVWIKIRDDEERTLECCDVCDAERSFDKSNPKEGWVYVFPTPKGSPTAADTEAPAAAAAESAEDRAEGEGVSAEGVASPDEVASETPADSEAEPVS